MEKIYIDYFQKIYEVQEYLENRNIDNIFLKVLSIDENSEKDNLFNEKKISIPLNEEDNLVTKIPTKFLKVLLKENMSSKTNYLCFFETEKLENQIKEDEIINFLKRDENQLMECLLNWDEDKIYFKEFKKLSKESREKIIKEFINNNDNNNEDSDDIFGLFGKSTKNKELKNNLKKYEEKILNYLEGVKPPLEKDLQDILDIKYFISYNEEMLKKKSEEKRDFLQEVLEIVIVKKEILEKYLDTLEGKRYFSTSYFKQAFYLYLKYILLLKSILKENSLEIESQKSNQSQKLNIKKMVTPKKNASYLEILQEGKINPEDICKLEKKYEGYFKVKDKIKTSEISNVVTEKTDIKKKIYDNYVIKNLNSRMNYVKIIPIFKLEELQNGKLYYISILKGIDKYDDYVGIYNKVLSELTDGNYIFENDEVSERMKRCKKEEIDEIGEVIGIYFND
ncbi:hypothetical protein [Candidatus Cetobacterium colombiensis]|uniref:Uncharacterized protein n=1 Tax=Candidatus Cetobacterium colombiensis TaxID=3073100 RepID=A0ABU4W6F8_9FUSO|nr:hypothetical protein [Candidatus Cetobacterium colombiensis]MDX8335116.1 hypothetical protein [Candidatus Cetobacterium colombiensis]